MGWVVHERTHGLFAFVLFFFGFESKFVMLRFISKLFGLVHGLNYAYGENKYTYKIK